jgi:hypothetical protein
VIDLFMLSGARMILSTSGSYANMARVFTSFSTASTPLHRLAANNDAPTCVCSPIDPDLPLHGHYLIRYPSETPK